MTHQDTVAATRSVVAMHNVIEKVLPRWEGLYLLLDRAVVTIALCF